MLNDVKWVQLNNRTVNYSNLIFNMLVGVTHHSCLMEKSLMKYSIKYEI